MHLFNSGADSALPACIWPRVEIRFGQGRQGGGGEAGGDHGSESGGSEEGWGEVVVLGAVVGYSTASGAGFVCGWRSVFLAFFVSILGPTILAASSVRHRAIPCRASMRCRKSTGGEGGGGGTPRIFTKPCGVRHSGLPASEYAPKMVYVG